MVRKLGSAVLISKNELTTIDQDGIFGRLILQYDNHEFKISFVSIRPSVDSNIIFNPEILFVNGLKISSEEERDSVICCDSNCNKSCNRCHKK